MIRQGQLQIWTKHSTLIFENLKPVEKSKNHFSLIWTSYPKPPKLCYYVHSFVSLELQFWWLSKRKRVLPMLWDGRDSPQTYCRKSDINQIHIWLTACSQYLVCKWIATNATRASYSSIVHFFCAAAAEQKILVQARRNIWGRLGFVPNKFLCKSDFSWSCFFWEKCALYYIIGTILW